MACATATDSLPSGPKCFEHSPLAPAGVEAPCAVSNETETSTVNATVARDVIVVRDLLKNVDGRDFVRRRPRGVWTIGRFPGQGGSQGSNQKVRAESSALAATSGCSNPAPFAGEGARAIFNS